MRERIDLAFHIMDREYGVTRLLDPEGENAPACNRPVTDQTAGISLLNQCFLCRLAGTVLFVVAVHAVYRGWAVPSRPAPSKQTRKKIADINIANHPNRKTKSVDSPIYIQYEDTDNQNTVLLTTNHPTTHHQQQQEDSCAEWPLDGAVVPRCQRHLFSAARLPTLVGLECIAHLDRGGALQLCRGREELCSPAPCSHHPAALLCTSCSAVQCTTAEDSRVRVPRCGPISPGLPRPADVTAGGATSRPGNVSPATQDTPAHLTCSSLLPTKYTTQIVWAFSGCVVQQQ